MSNLLTLLNSITNTNIKIIRIQAFEETEYSLSALFVSLCPRREYPSIVEIILNIYIIKIFRHRYKNENNSKWIKSFISLISTFPTVTQNPWNSYMINRLISSVGLLRRPFIRLSALDCPICSFCPQRAANSTNSITPVSACSTVDSAPLRAASYPHHDGCGAERVPSRDAVGDEAWTPRPLVSFQCRKPLRHAPKNRIVDARIACSRVRTCELTSGTNPQELWLDTIYKARKRKCRFFSQRCCSKQIDRFV